MKRPNSSENYWSIFRPNCAHRFWRPHWAKHCKMLETQLTHLEASDLIRQASESELAYLFKHALVQDTALSSLLLVERKRLHRRVGETLEAIYPECRVELAPLLAKHFDACGEDAKTLEYAMLAGDAAARGTQTPKRSSSIRLRFRWANGPISPLPKCRVCI